MPARPIAIALMFAALAPAVVNAAGGTPDWPCVQRKVADVSAGQIWQKGEIPQAAKDLARDKRILEVVDDGVRGAGADRAAPRRSHAPDREGDGVSPGLTLISGRPVTAG